MCEVSNAGLLADTKPTGVRASCRPVLASFLAPTAAAWAQALAALWGTWAGVASSLLELGWVWRGVPMGVLAGLGPPGGVSPALVVFVAHAAMSLEMAGGQESASATQKADMKLLCTVP